MTKRRHDEKDEKHEKEEKGGEKEEKYTRDPISAIFVGVLVIFLGIVFYFASNEMYGISWENVWNYILMCVGGAFLLSALLHSIVPQYRRPIMGEAFIGVILVIVGTVTIYEIEWWPLVLIIAGALVIIYGLGKMRRQEGS
jgi:cytochrome bd-type quinol oxidase subunit 2